ncbi:Basic leucine zipper 43 [Spatholobus suberectus]|nr:Basic leucine zipper 43 [Spatholobus suberectus]
MERNGANRHRGPPNYATLTQHCSSLSLTRNSTLNNETIEAPHEERLRDRVLTHLDSSQVLHCIPFYHSKLRLSNNSKSPNTSLNSNNNNADEAKALLEDRKKKRMFSNRESARRSRMRKKQQIESLQCHVDHLRILSRQLSQKIIYLLECNQQILQHNAQLKDKVSSLQVALSELLGSLGHVDQHHHFPTGLVPEPSSASAFHQSLASSGA